MRSPILFLLSVPLLGVAAGAYAQDNDELNPYIDGRVGGVLLGQGRGSTDNDADLLVARERFDENLGRQSIYFRFFDGSNDLERMHFDAVFVGATIQVSVRDFFGLASSDIFVGVGNIAADYGGFNNSRGLEGSDSFISGDERSFASVMTAGGGIDDFRVGVSFDDLDPGAQVNRGSAFVTLNLYAGGAQSPLAPNSQSGTCLGVLVGEDSTDAAPGDGDFSAGSNIEPEGNGGFQNPATTQENIRIFFLFEDVDIEESSVSLSAQAGASTGVASINIDNFAQGVDLDNDNAHETDGSLDAPNLPLQRVVFIAPTLAGPNNATIPASAFQISNFANQLQVGEFTQLSFSITVPANTPGGTYSGTARVFEDNNANGVFDANEASDTVTIQAQIVTQDTDGDGLADDEEDVNNNGVVDQGETNPNNPDSDNDGLEDGTEVNGQNSTNPLDSDSDNDGLLDGQEDTNGNGVLNGNETDPNDADSDNGGEPDGSEVSNNRDPLDASDDLTFNPNGDDDGDGLRNGLEDKNGNGLVDAGETNPNNADTDQDGLGDGIEDADLDGNLDGDETNPTLQDTDADGLPDGTEVLGVNPTDPLDADTDNDGLADGCEDQNGNGAFNGDELNPNASDTDSDGASDSDEDANGDCQFNNGETDGTDSDTDDGGEPDGSEIDGGRDPLNPDDDVIGSQSIYVIGGGSCSVDTTQSAPWWVLLLVGLFFWRRKR